MNLTEIANDDRKHRRFLSATPTPNVYDIELDSTTLGTYMTCPRSFMMYAVMGRDSGERDALNYGSAMHACMEQYFKLPVDEQPHCLPALINTLAACFEQNPCSSGNWRNLDHAIGAIKQWHALRQQLPVWEVYHDDEGPFVERSFRIPLVSLEFNQNFKFPANLLTDTHNDADSLFVHRLNVYFTGKIDLVVYDRLGKLRIVDHKTSSMAGSPFWGQFPRSPQMRGYTWAGSRLLGERVPGVLIHALFGRKPSRTGIPYETETCEFDYDDEQLDRWYMSTVQHCQQIVNHLVGGQDTFPEHSVSCHGKFGQCAYHAVCNAPTIVQHMHLLSGAYADRTWSPLTH